MIEFTRNERKLLNIIEQGPKLSEAFDIYDFDTIYSTLWSVAHLRYDTSPRHLTTLLLKLEIDPLKYVSKVWTHMYYCLEDITRVVIPNNVKAIDRFAFYGCEQLQYVVIPSSVRTIGNAAFGCCPILDNIKYTGTMRGFEHILKGRLVFNLRDYNLRDYSGPRANDIVVQCKDGDLKYYHTYD